MAEFKPTKQAEKDYAKALRKVAKTASAIVEAHVDGAELVNEAAMMAALKSYSEALKPWAAKASAKMIESVNANSKRAWASRIKKSTASGSKKTANKDARRFFDASPERAKWASRSKEISEALKNLMAQSSVGLVARQLLDEQVELIQSIPIEAGTRAQDLAFEAATGGKRPDEVARMLLETNDVTESRANVIARTGVANSNAAINQARAEYVGAPIYKWRTADDGAVRESHQEMDGKIFAYASPPTLSDGMTGNPGGFPNCRCWAEPMI